MPIIACRNPPKRLKCKPPHVGVERGKVLGALRRQGKPSDFRLENRIRPSGQEFFDLFIEAVKRALVATEGQGCVGTTLQSGLNSFIDGKVLCKC